jgi:hypothetical protein
MCSSRSGCNIEVATEVVVVVFVQQCGICIPMRSLVKASVLNSSRTGRHARLLAVGLNRLKLVRIGNSWCHGIGMEKGCSCCFYVKLNAFIKSYCSSNKVKARRKRDWKR